MLYSGWTGIVAASLGAVLLVVLAAVLVAGEAVVWVSVVVSLLAAGAVAVVLLDLPLASDFSASGITRHTMLRHEHLPWARINRLTRHRSGVARTRLDRAGGGLVAVCGRRRYTLVDRMESAMEFDDLLRVLGSEAERLGVEVIARPPDGRTPTWVYRRRSSRPEGPTDLPH